MRERIKTALLFFLIIFAIYLSSKLWIDFSSERKVGIEAKEKEKVELKDYISAETAIVNFSKDKHTVLDNPGEQGLFQSFKGFFSDVFTKNDYRVSLIGEDEYEKAIESSRSVVFTFIDKFPLRLIARTFNIMEKNNFIDDDKNLKEVAILLYSGSAMFKTDASIYKITELKTSLSLPNSIVNNLELKPNLTYYYNASTILGEKSPLYIPYQDEYASYIFDKYTVAHDFDILDRDNARSFAQRFFNKEFKYLKELEEKDFSKIYSYDSEVIKLKYDGSIEYFDPIKKIYKERNLLKSIEAAIAFLQDYIDEEQPLKLSKIEEITSEDSLGYRISFDYYLDGLKLNYEKDSDHYASVDVFMDEVRFASVNKASFNKDSAEAFYTKNILELIDKNAILFHTGTDDNPLKSIDKISIVYLVMKDEDEAITPKIRIDTKKGYFIFDAKTFRLIKERDYELEQS